MTDLRRLLASWLFALAAWVDGPLPPVPDVVPEPSEDALELLTAELVAQADALPGEPSGEFKRHWVYAKLVKAFPDRQRREVGLAIEQAVSGL